MKLAMFIFLMTLTTAVAFATPIDQVENADRSLADYVYMTCERKLEGLKCAVENNEQVLQDVQTELDFTAANSTGGSWKTEWIVGDAYQRLSAE